MEKKRYGVDKMNFRKVLINIFPWLILLAFSFLAFSAFLDPGFFIIHDNTQIQRTFEMAKSISDGVFPVRWVSDLGYGNGYPIFNFYAPLFYYISGILTFTGFSALVATKIAAVFAIILSSFSMYFLAKEFWGKWGGLFSAVLYTYAPFHAVDIFVRGDFAELLAYGLIPLPFLGIYNIYRENSTKKSWFWVCFTSISFAMLITSHNLTAFMATPFLAIEALILGTAYFKKVRKFPIHITLSILLGVLISSFYWIPALLELNYTNVFSIIGGGSDFRDHFVCITQLWYSPWGFAGSAPGCLDGLSFEIGKLHIMSVLLAIAMVPFVRKRPQSYVVIFASFIFFSSLFLMTEYSRFLWELLEPMKFFQFPWRFLLMTSFASSLLGGFLIWLISKRIRREEAAFVLAISISLISSVYYSRFFYPQSISIDPSDNYTNEASLKWFTSKISDEYMPPSFPTPESEAEIENTRIEIDNKEGQIKSLSEKTGRITASLSLADNTQAKLNIANFPAWNFYVNGQKTKAEEANGVYELNLPAGNHIVEARFQQTGIEKTSNTAAFVGIAILVAGIIFSRKKK